MKDILFNFNDGTIFKDGDLNVGECTEQNKRLLLVCEKGSYKEFPATCVGLNSFLENEDLSGMLREVRAQFIGDGMTVNEVKFDNGKLVTNASY